MASNSVITQAKLKEFYDNYIYPYLNGSAHSGYTPIGTIISLMGNSAPDNYLVCDGTIYDITDYPLLASYFNTQFGSSNYFGGDGTTTFAVPDLQGEFLRGSGTNSHANQGNGADVGVHQNATQIPRFSNYSGEIGTYLDDNEGIDITNIDSNTGLTGRPLRRISPDATYSSDTNTQSVTTRPTNTSVLFCIAYKDIYTETTIGGKTVTLTDIADGQSLVYDASTDEFINGDGGHTYSTSEKVVGTWIDGKPLYEITISCTSPSSAGSESDIYNLSSLSADYIVNQEITLIIGSEMMPANWHYGSSSFGVTNVFARCTRAYIKMSVGVSAYCSMPVIAILRYTKTTD